MFDVGGMEFVVIIVVALLVIGPERIPEVARMLGRFIGQLRQLGGDIGDPIQQVREALHEGIQEGEALAHQIQADVEAAQEDIRSAAAVESDPAAAGQTAAVQPAAATGIAAPAPDPGRCRATGYRAGGGRGYSREQRGHSPARRRLRGR